MSFDDHTDIFLELDDNNNPWPLIRALESCNLGPRDQQTLAERLKPNGSGYPRFVLRHGKRGRPRKLSTVFEAIDKSEELARTLLDANSSSPIKVKQAIGKLQDAHRQESGYSERSIFRSRRLAKDCGVAPPPPWRRGP